MPISSCTVRCWPVLQHSCITRSYKRNTLGQKLAWKYSAARRTAVLKSERTLYPNSWWHFVQLLTSQNWVTDSEWHPHKRSPEENWQQFKSNLLWFLGEMWRLLSSHLSQYKTHHRMPVGEWLHTHIFRNVFSHALWGLKTKSVLMTNVITRHTLEPCDKVPLNLPVMPHHHHKPTIAHPIPQGMWIIWWPLGGMLCLRG